MSAQCYNCGRPYGDEYGFPDLVVPHDVWKIISPTGNDGGLLCPSCMCLAAHRAGVSCTAKFTSGPFCGGRVMSEPKPLPSGRFHFTGEEMIQATQQGIGDWCLWEEVEAALAERDREIERLSDDVSTYVAAHKNGVDENAALRKRIAELEGALDQLLNRGALLTANDGRDYYPLPCPEALDRARKSLEDES